MRHISPRRALVPDTCVMSIRGSAGLALFLTLALRETSACPPDHYPADAWPHACHPCPAHTRTIAVPSGGEATSVHDCKCDAGFLCMYYKQVRATVTLNATLSAFEHDEGGVRSTFISGVASAAGVGREQVHVHFVVIRLDHRRRVLRRLLGHPAHGQLQVTVVVTDTHSDVSGLRRHLGIMHERGDAWIVERRVLVLAIPSGRI